MKRVTVREESLENLFKEISECGAKNDYVHIKTPIKQFCKTWLDRLDPKPIEDNSGRTMPKSVSNDGYWNF